MDPTARLKGHARVPHMMSRLIGRVRIPPLPAWSGIAGRATAGALALVVLIRNAWLCDDAYITFRTIDNLLNGYGPRWNVIERVQTYTHPLWFLVLSPLVGLTRDVYYTSILLSLVCTVVAILVSAVYVARVQSIMMLGVVLLLSSKAFVDYSTSGLENALSYLLLALFCATWLKLDDAIRAAARSIDECSQTEGRGQVEDRRGATLRILRAEHAGTVCLLGFLASLCLLNRLDTILLVAPFVVAVLARTGMRMLGSLILGAWPLLLWQAWSLVYYGAAFPNPAYAKLQTGISRADLVMHGVRYLVDSLETDPVTLATIGLAGAASFVTRALYPFGIGLLAYLAYIVWIGGDFMSGRFLAVPMLLSVVAIGRLGASVPPKLAGLLAGVVLIASLANSASPLTSGAGYGLNVPEEFRRGGIADERRAYYPWTGLLRVASGAADISRHPWAERGRQARGVPQVITFESIGLLGYFAGPAVHIVDPMGLSDPLLARLPAEPEWRPGHFPRRIPEGYIDAIRTCLDAVFVGAHIAPPATDCVQRRPDAARALTDRKLAAYYDQLRLVTQGPLWTQQRLRAVVAVSFTRPGDAMDRPTGSAGSQ
jgi:arabinofuranosyltransferase